MIFFVANDGTVIKSEPSPVYQGSVNTNNIYLVAPFAANMSVAVAFQLPNGVRTSRYLMTPVNEITSVVNKETGQVYSGWKFSMPNEVTQYFGTVKAQFYFYSAEVVPTPSTVEHGGIVTASSTTSFVVEQGVPEILPDAPDADVYETILSNLSLLQEQLNNGAFAARAIYAWNSTYTYGAGEITYYPDVGQFGAFVKSKIAGNLNHPPYDEEGKFNSLYWDLVLDFEQLNKAIVIWGFNEAVDITDLEWEVS